MSLYKETRESLETLRALSQTCRRFRALTLPLLWSVVHIATVDELVRLKEGVKAPWIAPLILHFFWNMNGDVSRCRPYGEEHGTLLDMAFIDRGALWDRIREENEYEVQVEMSGEMGQLSITYFVDDDGREYYEPGFKYLAEEDEPRTDQETTTNHLAMTSYDTRGPNEERSGPDGKGLEKAEGRIRNAQEFNEALAFIASQMTSLEAFRWCSPVANTPAGVFEALSKLQILTAFRIRIVSERSQPLAREYGVLGIKMPLLFTDNLAFVEFTRSFSLGAGVQPHASLYRTSPQRGEIPSRSRGRGVRG